MTEREKDDFIREHPFIGLIFLVGFMWGFVRLIIYIGRAIVQP